MCEARAERVLRTEGNGNDAKLSTKLIQSNKLLPRAAAVNMKELFEKLTAGHSQVVRSRFIALLTVHLVSMLARQVLLKNRSILLSCSRKNEVAQKCGILSGCV